MSPHSLILKNSQQDQIMLLYAYSHQHVHHQTACFIFHTHAHNSVGLQLNVPSHAPSIYT